MRDLRRGVLITPNIDQIVKLQSDKEFYDITRRAEWVVCDSRILFLCSKLTRHPLKETIPGSSFFPAYCDYHRDDEHCCIFLLGGLDGVADEARERINARVGRQLVVGSYSPSFGFEKNEDENRAIARMVNESRASTVLVGVGCPKQEKWIDRHKAEMPGVDVWMALGATIDFEAGRVRRAPRVVQRLCMEWLYRFLQEPRRMFRRYFVDDPVFFWLFARQLAGRYSDPFEPP